MRGGLAKALLNVADKRGAESSDQFPILRQEPVMLKEACRQEEEKVRRLKEIVEREQQKPCLSMSILLNNI